MNKEKISKFMSFALRHDPDKAGIEVNSKGWTNISELVQAIKNEYNLPPKEVSKNDIMEVVEDGKQENKKNRYEIHNNKVRAKYGHSIDVKIENRAENPPKLLYHGTPKSNIESIRENGLKPMNRNEVHLADNKEDARKVGKRHSEKIVILQVKSNSLDNVLHKRNESIYTIIEVPPEKIIFPSE